MANHQRIRIPLSIPCLGMEEERALLECLKTGWVSSISPTVGAFEKQFSEKLSIPHAAATNSGTAALHLALLALGIRQGDEVIVPALSFVATVNPVRYVGATPVFVDVEPDAFGLDPERVRNAITPRTKAILLTHLYGLPARVAEILEIANAHGIPVIEDAAEALGATVEMPTSEGNKIAQVGTLGTLGCFSFNGNKTLTCGGGGMVVSRDAKLIQRIIHLSTQAREQGIEISHDEIGYNLRMTGLQAAMGLGQLEKMDMLLARKKAIAKRYAEELRTSQVIKPGATFPPPPGISPSYWLSVVLLKEPGLRDELIKKALASGIEMRPFFKPLPLLKPYEPWATQSYPVAEDLWRRGVCIPSSPNLSEIEQQEVIRVLREACRESRWDRPKRVFPATPG